MRYGDLPWLFMSFPFVAFNSPSTSPWMTGGVLGVVQSGESLSLWSQKTHLCAKAVFGSHPTGGSYALGGEVGGQKDWDRSLEGMPSSTTCRVVTRDAGGLSGIPVTLLVTRARSDYEPPWLHSQPPVLGSHHCLFSQGHRHRWFTPPLLMGQLFGELQSYFFSRYKCII